MIYTPRPRALLFDLDDTLLDHTYASRTAILKAMEASEIPEGFDPDSALLRWRDLEARHFQRYLDGELTFEEQRVIRTCEFLHFYGVENLGRSIALRWFDRYKSFYENSWRVFDDVPPFFRAIAELDPALILAVVTNGEEAQQAAKLAALRLDWLDLFTSSTVGARKPDSAIYLRVCDALKTPPDTVWFIGDNLEVDALGAQNAGLQGIWLNRRGQMLTRAKVWRASTLIDIVGWIRLTR